MSEVEVPRLGEDFPLPAHAKPKRDDGQVQLVKRTVRKCQKRLATIDKHPYIVAAIGPDKGIVYASNLSKAEMKRMLEIMVEKL